MGNGGDNSLLRAGMQRAIDMDAEIEATISPQSADENDIQFMRRVYAKKRAFWNQDKPPVADIRTVQAETRHGAVGCRLYYNGDNTSPVLFYLHGGGFVVGNLDTHDRICRLHAQRGKLNVIAVDYGKSPEHKFPVALHQFLDVLKFFYAGADNFGLNRHLFCLSGDSAGAHLSLAALLCTREGHGHEGREGREGEPKIACALLYYGAYGMGDSHSIRTYGSEDYGLSWQLMEWYKNQYLENNEQSFDTRFNLLLNSMKNLPPLFILGVTFDPLCDDSRYLAEKVNSAGGICKYSEYRGVLHGFMHYSKVLADSALAIFEGCAFLETHLANYE